MEFFGGEALIFTRFFRGKPIFFRGMTQFFRGKPIFYGVRRKGKSLTRSTDFKCNSPIGFDQIRIH